MSKRTKYILFTLGALIGLVVIVLVGARIYLSTSHAQRTIQAKIDAAIPGAVTWDDLGLSLTGGRIELENVLLTGPDGEKLAGFDRLYVNLALTDLFQKNLTVSDFVLEKPWADLKRDENGELNLLKAFPEPGPPRETPEPEKEAGGMPVDIIVTSARITEGRFTYQDLAEKIDASVSEVGLRASLRLKERAGDFRFEIGKGRIETPEWTSDLETFLAEATLRDGRLDPLRFRVAAAPAQLDLSGSVSRVFEQPELDLDLSLDLALGKVRELIAMEAPLSGELNLTLAADGPPGNPDADLSLSYGGGEVFDYEVTSLDLRASLADRVLELEALSARTGAGRADLSGRADARNAFPEGFLSKPMDLDALAYRLHLTGENLNLDRIVPEVAKVRGTAVTDLVVAGKGVRYPAIDADVKLDLAGDDVRAPGIEDAVDVAATLDASLAAGGVTTVRTLTIRAGDADLSAAGTFDIPNLTTTADIDLKAPDLGRTLATLGIGGISGGATLQAKVNGPVTAPVFDLDLTGNGLAYNEITVGDIRLDAESDDQGVVTIATLSIDNNGSEIDGSGTVGLFGQQSLRIDPELPMDISLTLNDLEAGDFLQKPPVTGSVSGSLSAEGKLMDLRAEADLSANDLATDQAEIGDVDLQAQLEKGTLSVARLAVRNRESSVTLSGSADLLKEGTFKPLEDPAFDIDLSSEAVKLADFLPRAGGTLSLQAQAEGTLSRPTADIRLAGDGLDFGEVRIGDVTVKAALNASGLLTIDRLTLANQGSAIEGDGTIRLYKAQPGFDPTLPLDLTLTLSDVEAKDFVQADLAQGQLSGKAAVSGSIKNPRADLALRTRDLAVQGTRIGSVDLDADFVDGKALIDRIVVKNGDSDLRIAGTAQVLSPRDLAPLPDPAFDLEIESDGLFLQDFLPDMKGKLTLNADLAGSLKQPKGNIDLSGEDLHLGPQDLAGLRLSARMTGDRVRIDPLTVTVGKGETLTATGTYTLPDAYDLTIRSSGISLASIDPVREADIAGGTVTLDLSGSGTVAEPSLTGAVAVSDVEVQGKPLDDIRLNVDLTDGLAKISGDAGFGLTATYHLKNKEFSATANFQRTDLGPYFALANQSDLDGRLSGRIEAEGNAGAPEAVTASVDLANLLLNYRGTELIATDSLAADYRNGTLSIPGFSLDLLRKGHLRVQGEATPGGAMSINVNGDIPLDVARAFTDALPDIGGQVALSADIRGRMDEPEIQADATLQNVAMSVPGIAQRLHDLNGTLRMTPASLTLKDVAGRLGDGRFFLRGEVGLKNFQPTAIDIGLRAETLPIRVDDMLELALNADLSMSGTPQSAAIEGEAVILEGRYYKDINLSLLEPLKGLATKKREVSPSRPPRRSKKGEAADPSLLDNVSLDIFVKNRSPFLVDNNLAYLEIDPDLHVEGTLDDPLISGRAEIQTGTVTYRNRTFDVTRGVIDFLNPYEIEPTLDISAEAEIRKWQVMLSISGTPEALNVELSSTPSLDDSDILSLILLGKTGGELISGEGGSTQAPGQMVADIVSKTVGEDIKKAAGLDQLEVEVNGDNGEEETGGVKVTLGKDLSRRMSVKYQVESRDGEMVGRTSAEYKILENLLMSGFQDNTGTFGGELKFRMEFR